MKLDMFILISRLLIYLNILYANVEFPSAPYLRESKTSKGRIRYFRPRYLNKYYSFQSEKRPDVPIKEQKLLIFRTKEENPQRFLLW